MSGLSLLDLFCGGGGSSYGAALVPGVTVKMAANHWPVAIDVHQLNHPNTDHDCADISQVDPRRYPTTELMWSSPSCTNHSVAQGRSRQESAEDADAERSRSTMWDVQRFTEYHRYRFVFVENVVEVRKWSGFRGWKISMEDTGYCLHEVFLNAAFAGQLGPAAAQWRDRWFCLAHPKGTPCPDTERWTCPTAWCESCGSTRETYQAWKNPEKQAGKYRAQYLYRCRTCNGVTEPLTRPASDIIDWSDLGSRIGDRKRPLAEKTLNRIKIGLERYGPALVPVEGRDGKQPFALDVPMRTITARNETGLMIPDAFIAELRGGSSTARSVSVPLATVTASGNHHGLVVPYYSQGVTRPTSDPLRTVTTVDTAALVRAQASVEDCLFRMLSPQEYAAAMEFPSDYNWAEDRLSKRVRVRLAGNAVAPNCARDLVACAVETIT
ncbi:DNA cytosine methyltransferase [Streptomyces sp. NBC_00414]|uniref:DNA cytosine methyltransferase n=1 Tax=Streptomyces sp. NBC_00414 TaxID=2975739 RepID=UPI002E1FC72A